MDPSDNLGTLLDLTQDKIVVVDAEGTYLYANAATERILGYDRETLVETNTFEYVHPEDIGTVRAVFGSLTDAGDDLTETVQYRHLGAPRKPDVEPERLRSRRIRRLLARRD